MKNLTLDIKQDIDNSKSKCSRVVITFLLRRTRIAGVVACGVILFTVMGVSGNSAQTENLRVRVGVYDNSPKISLSENGQPEGIFIDIIEEIAKQERWQLEYIYGTWQEGLDRLAAGELDLMPDVAISKSRGDAYVFHKEPVLSDWFQVYAPKGSGIQSVLDLAGKRIAVLDGSIQEETFSNMCNDYGIRMSLVSLPDYHRALKELEKGKVDAVIANRFYGMHHSRTHNLEDTAVIFTPTRLFYAAKATAPSSALLPVIDQHLARMKRESDSVYYNSLRRWSSEPTVSFLPEYVKLIFSFVAFCLLCIVIWNITLRHKIALRTSALTKSNRMLRMLSDCNEALFRYTDEKELLSRICGIITKVGGYTAVWINLINSDAGKDTSRLPITAHAGLNQQELQTLQRILSDAQNTVTQTIENVIEERQPVLHDDPVQTNEYESLILNALKRRNQHLLCFPLIASDKSVGALTVITPFTKVRSSEILELFQEMTGEIAFGVEHIRLGLERQQAIDEQQHSELRFRRVIEEAPEAIVIQTRGRIAFINPAACVLFGAASPDQLLGQPILKLTHPDYHSKVEQHIIKTNILEQHGSMIEEVFLRLDGTHVIVEVNSVPFTYQNESGALIFIRDITQRRLHEHRYQSLVEDMPALICRFAPDGTLSFVNSTVCSYTDTSKEKLIGRNFLTMISEEDRHKVHEALSRVTPENPLAEVAHVVHRKDGELRQVRWVNRAIFESNGRIKEFQTVGLDVTEQQRMEERLSQSHKMETIGLLAGGVAHDFNNGLQSILGFAELALMQMSPAAPYAAHIKEVIESARRARKLTGQLLAFSRKSPMEITRVQLNDEIANRMEMLKRLLGEEIKIETSLQPELPIIMADAGHIEQVLLNLVVNARDAISHCGTIKIETEVEKFSRRDVRLNPDAKPGSYVCLSVTDTGCGISQEVLPRIFDPFFTTKPKDKGTGLGLSTVYGIVSQLSGWIDVQTELERGTTFKVYFPKSADEAEPAQEKPENENQQLKSSARILVVEDQDDVGRIAVRMLKSFGFDAKLVNGVEETNRLLQNKKMKFDMIFSDVVLGDGNGLELAIDLLRQFPHMRFLFATGYADERSRWDAIEEYGWKCLIKPYSRDELFEAVNLALSL